MYKEIIICVITLVLGGFIALQFKSFKQWLIYACSEAEQYFGSKTGELKLQYVYNLAVNSKFSIITKVITFGMFQSFVKAALEKMEKMIESSEAIAKILKGSQIVDVEDTETK
jgi:hypothetical protein